MLLSCSCSSRPMLPEQQTGPGQPNIKTQNPVLTLATAACASEMGALLCLQQAFHTAVAADMLWRNPN